MTPLLMHAAASLTSQPIFVRGGEEIPIPLAPPTENKEKYGLARALARLALPLAPRTGN